MMGPRDLGDLADELRERGQSYAQEWIAKFNRQGRAFGRLYQETERQAAIAGRVLSAAHPLVRLLRGRMDELLSAAAETRRFRDWVYEVGFAYLGWDEDGVGDLADLGALPALVIGGVAVTGAAYLSRAYTTLETRREEHAAQVDAARTMFERIAAAPPAERPQLLAAAEKALNSSASVAGPGAGKVWPWVVGAAVLLGLGAAYHYRADLRRAIRPGA